MFVVFTKAGCPICEAAKRLLQDRELPYEAVECQTVDDVYVKLGMLAPAGLSSFPVILRDNRFVGGFTHLRDMLEEPILAESPTRFSAFPVQYPAIYDLYKKAVASFWTADEISLSQDAQDFQTLGKDEQHFLKHILAFFASSDGIVNENLLSNFASEVQAADSRQFYAFQAFNEAEHSRTYGLLIDALIRDPQERETLFNAIVHVPAVKQKAEWALKWLDPTKRSFAERLVAFLCVEGILFSGSFCAIFWMKKHRPGLLPGLSLSNQYISRDEALHCEHAAELYKLLEHPLAQKTVHQIVREAVENEKTFITDAVPCSLVGMNAPLMSQYIEFVADSLCRDIGYGNIYGTKNPFPWMEAIGLDARTNFFEMRVSEYTRAGIMSDAKGFALDAEF
jgi:ribonucleoside-diphosphate reductase subunit M2